MPGAAAAIPASPGLLPIFFIFVKIGAMVFSSGYVLLVFLRSELVERHAWLTQQQLLDAVPSVKSLRDPSSPRQLSSATSCTEFPTPSWPPSESCSRHFYW